MIFLLLVAAIAGTPQARPELIERVPLPRPARVVVTPLAARVELVGLTAEQVKAVARASALCPQTEQLLNGRTALSCSTRALRAKIENGRLSLTALRTTPWTTDLSAPPNLLYDPVAFGLGGPCPGDTPSSRGECAFVAGRYADAALALRDAWQAGGSRASHAALRLGDIAMTLDDRETAAGWYDRSGPAGIFARIAAARLCELLLCFDGPTARLPFDAFDDAGVPVEVRDEMVLRHARALALSSRLDDAVARLLAKSTVDSTPCARAPTLCRAIATEALRARKGRDAPDALSLALSIPSAFSGPGAPELALMVADHTERIGALIFSANALASSSESIEPAALDAHLLRCADLYVRGGDPTRADTVLRFAASRGFFGGARAARWRALRKAVDQARHDDDDPVGDHVAGATP